MDEKNVQVGALECNASGANVSFKSSSDNPRVLSYRRFGPLTVRSLCNSTSAV